MERNLTHSSLKASVVDDRAWADGVSLSLKKSLYRVYRKRKNQCLLVFGKLES